MLSAKIMTAALEPASALAIIDKEIAAHESAIRELRTRRNSHSTLSKLPNELISEIFIIAKAMSALPLPYDHYSRIKGGSWLNVTGVCRAWREIALNTPRLWNEMDIPRIKSLEWASTMLARSKDAPLFVELHLVGSLGSQRERDIAKEIFKHIARIQESSIFAERSILLELFNPDSAIVPAMKMQSLRINPLTSATTSTVLMSQVFKIPMPSLHTLILLSVDLPSAIPLLPQLRRLIVKSVSSSMSIGLLLSITRSTPSLEELEFQHDRAGLSAGEINDHTIVELPKLSQISLKTSYSESAALFQYIKYPPSSHVRFECTSPAPDPPKLAGVVAHFASCDVAANVDEVSILKISSTQLQFKVSVDGIPTLVILYHLSDLARAELFRLGKMIPSSKIHTLYLSDGFALIEKAEWMELFDHFEHAHELKVEGAKEEFIEMLMKSPSNNQAPFSNLNRLTLERCSFDVHFTSVIKSFIAERKELEEPIGAFKLRIRNCPIHLSIVRELEECVPFDWDSTTLWTEEMEMLGINEDHGEEDDEGYEYQGSEVDYADLDPDYDAYSDDEPMPIPWFMGAHF